MCFSEYTLVHITLQHWLFFLRTGQEARDYANKYAKKARSYRGSYAYLARLGLLELFGGLGHFLQ